MNFVCNKYIKNYNPVIPSYNNFLFVNVMKKITILYKKIANFNKKVINIHINTCLKDA